MHHERDELKREMKEGKTDTKGSVTEDKNSESKITSLLQLRAKLEQEVHADTRKMEDLKKEMEMKLGWMHQLDEILSEASFQPASALLGDLMPTQEEPELEGKQDRNIIVDLRSFSEPVNLKNPKDGTIYATLNFMQGNIMIMLNQKLHLVPESRVFQEFFQRNIVSIFEKEGGKIYLERDDSGILRMITIAGSFKTELKEAVVKNLARFLIQFRDASKDVS